MAGDFCARFAWLLSFSTTFTSFGGELNLFFFELLEIVRRFIWVVFRVEWEHICVRGKTIVPVDSSPSLLMGSYSDGGDDNEEI
jgi:hypothetical protein